MINLTKSFSQCVFNFQYLKIFYVLLIRDINECIYALEIVEILFGTKSLIIFL